MKIRRLLLVLLLALLPVWALAELPLAYPAETVLSVMPLTPAQRALVEHLYQPVMEGRTRIDLPEGTRYDDVAPAMQALMLDYPELFHLHREYSVSYYQNAPQTAVAVSPQYRMSARSADHLRGQMYDAAQRLVQADRSALGLHDALVAHVTYGGTTEMRHTAASALVDGVATCEGYAQALSLLYRMAGYPCGVITGAAFNDAAGQMENHAWNIAWLNGCTLIDATWNDQEGAGLNTHWYYGLSTAQMAADHAPDGNLAVPACGEQDGWHRSRGWVIDSYGEALAALGQLVRSDEPVNLRFSDAALFRRIVEDTGAFLDDYNRWCSPENCFYGSYSYLVSAAQQCVIFSSGGR